MKNNWALTLLLMVVVWTRLLAQETAQFPKNTSPKNTHVSGQLGLSAQEREFFDWYFESEFKYPETTGRFLLIDEISCPIASAKEAFSRDTILDMNNPFRGKDVNRDFLILSNAEKEYIFSELNTASGSKWNYPLSPNSILVNSEELNKSRMASPNRTPTDYFSFSKPIFLRQNSICILDTGYHCGELCGSGGLVVYRKQNGKWGKWLTINRWIS